MCAEASGAGQAGAAGCLRLARRAQERDSVLHAPPGRTTPRQLVVGALSADRALRVPHHHRDARLHPPQPVQEPAAQRARRKVARLCHGHRLRELLTPAPATPQALCRPGDPQGFHYLGLKGATRTAFAWHLLRPLLGFNLRHALAESILRPRNLAAAARSGEIFALAAIQLAILAIVTGGGAHLGLAALPFTSAATFGLFFSQLRG